MIRNDAVLQGNDFCFFMPCFFNGLARGLLPCNCVWSPQAEGEEPFEEATKPLVAGHLVLQGFPCLNVSKVCLLEITWTPAKSIARKPATYWATTPDASQNCSYTPTC